MKQYEIISYSDNNKCNLVKEVVQLILDGFEVVPYTDEPDFDYVVYQKEVPSEPQR